MQYFMGIDIGTTSVKALIAGQDGSVTCGQSQKYDLLFPAAGWAEQSPDQMWNAVLAAIESVLLAFHGDRKSIVSIALSTQRDTLICTDENMHALRNAITWMDSRAVDECEALKKRIDVEYIYDTTGVGVSPIWTLSFILWLREHEPETYRETACFGLVHDYILCKMGAKQHVLDYSNACQTMLFDYKNLCWDAKLLEYAGLTCERLPKLVEGGTVVGTLSAQIAKMFELASSVALVSGGGDQQCAALGAGANHENDVEIGIGTAANLLCITNKPMQDSLHRMLCHRAAIGASYVMEGAMLAIGRLIEWLKDELLTGYSLDEINDMIQRETLPGSRGIIVLPHFEGAACPYWNPHAKGVIMGLTLSHTKAEVARSFFEATCFEIKKALDLLRSFHFAPETVLVSGGATRSAMWMQMLADILQIKVRVTKQNECAALGAAILAALGCGAFEDASQAVDKLVTIQQEYVPNPANAEVYFHIYNKNNAIYDIIERNNLY